MSEFQWDEDEVFADRPIQMDANGQWTDVSSGSPVEEVYQPRQGQPAQYSPGDIPKYEGPDEDDYQDEESTYEQEEVGYEFQSIDDTYDNAPAIEEEQDYAAVLSDASLRLEQGNLYKLIMNHDLFGGSNADPRAIRTVQNAVRKFAKEQMEIMLGMRQATPDPVIQAQSNDFNYLELETLKKLAAAATRNATKQIASVASQPPKTHGLNQINQTPQTTPAPVRQQAPLQRQAAPPRPPQQPQRPLQRAPQKPIKRTPRDREVERILEEEGVTREMIEATFPSDYKPLPKRSRITEDLLNQRNSDIKKRSRALAPPVPGVGIPMPSYEQQVMLAEQHAQQSNVPGSKNSQMIQAAMLAPIKK